MSNLKSVKCIVEEIAFANINTNEQAWFRKNDEIDFEVVDGSYFLVDEEYDERFEISEIDFVECFEIV